MPMYGQIVHPADVPGSKITDDIRFRQNTLGFRDGERVWVEHTSDWRYGDYWTHYVIGSEEIMTLGDLDSELASPGVGILRAYLRGELNRDQVKAAMHDAFEADKRAKQEAEQRRRQELEETIQAERARQLERSQLLAKAVRLLSADERSRLWNLSKTFDQVHLPAAMLRVEEEN